MKIGVVSDSHDHSVHIYKCLELFKERDVIYTLHLGDYINPNSVRAFAGIRLVGIVGNNDGDIFRLMQAFQDVGGEIKGAFYEFEEGNVRFACYHGTEYQITDALIKCEKYDVVLSGHTHKCVNTRVKNTLSLNPGTLHGFGNKATALTFDTESEQAEFIEL